MLKRLLSARPIDELISASAGGEHELSRALGFFNLTSLGLGGIIGAGIFVMTGQAAADYAGPAVVLSFVFSAIACAFAALCYAELASMIPVAGSAYTYAYATMGRLVAWIIGWSLVLEYLFSASTVAVGWSGYVASFLRDFGVTIPAAWVGAPLAYDATLGWQRTGAIMNAPAVLVTLALSAMVVAGIRESARYNNAMVILKCAVIILFVAFGAAHVDPANWTPFIPENRGGFGEHGASGVLRGAGFLFFAYIGFDSVSCAAQEAKRPQRDVPAAIIASLAICTVIYVAVSLVLTGLVRYDKLGVPDPIAVGVDAAGPGLLWLRPVIKIGAIAGLTTVILSSLVGQPRIFYSMAKDGMLPPAFGEIHPRFRTPHVSTILTGVVGAALAGVFPLEVLGELVSIGTLLAFVFVFIGVLVLRYTRPELKRPFRTPLAPVVSLLGAAGALVQMFSLPPDTWLRLLVWMALGFVVFFAYGARHAR